MERIVIVGAGLTAAYAAETLREEGWDGELTVVGAEKLLPYPRPQLSKEVLQDTKEFHLQYEADFYADQNIEVITGAKATELDLHNRRVTLNEGGSWTTTACCWPPARAPVRCRCPGLIARTCCGPAPTSSSCTPPSHRRSDW